MNHSPYDPYYISEKYRIIADIKATNQQLDCHPICSMLNSHSRIKAFISYHIFDAWDTNKLVFPLQNKISADSRANYYKYHGELNKLLEENIFNRSGELYFGDESNQDFVNYLYAIAEAGIDSDACLRYFLEAPNHLNELKPGIKALIEFNSSVANWGTISEMIAVLFLGKKELDLRLFLKIIEASAKNAEECPFLLKYVEKLHQNQSFRFELLTFKLLNYFCQDEAEQIRALQTGLKALYLRKQLWNYALVEIRKIMI